MQRTQARLTLFQKNKAILLPLFILPIIIAVIQVVKTQSMDYRSRASEGYAKNICNLPISEKSTLGYYAKTKSFNVGSLLSECFSDKLSANEQAKCQETIKNNFDGMRLNYQMSWRAMEPSQGQINWSLFDKAVSFAKTNNLKIHFFHLIWSNHERYENPPDWIFPNRTDTSCGTRTEAELDQIMKKHIQDIIIRGGDTISAWNVVNEAFNNDGSLQKDCFYKISGSDYIDKAFHYARDASSNATLVLNDYFPNGSSFRPKTDGFFAYVKAAKKRGVPIDAVGLQNHQLNKNDYQFSQDYLDDLSYFFQKAKDAGVKVYITETDIYQNGHSQEQVAKVYKDTVSLCLNNSNCASFAVWGISDKYSWARTPTHANLSNAKPLLFDETYQRKLTYYGVMEAIKENTSRICIGTSPTPTNTPIIEPRCYSNKDKKTCESSCGEKNGISNKCRWLDTKGSCVEGLKPCK